MKYLLLLFIIIFPSFLFSEKNKIEVLHPRIGDTISLEKRDYFGLFPNIESFKFATLQKSKEKEYIFNINFAERTYQRVVDDSVIVALRDYLDNYEVFINQNRTPDKKFARYLVPEFVTISTFYKTNVIKLKLKLLNNANADEFLVYHNDSCLVLAENNNVNSFKNMSDFRIINYNEIDTIFNIKYGIIKGKKFVFEKNFDILDTLSMFYQINQNIAPELKNLLNQNKIQPLKTDNIEFDFDEPYLKKLSLTNDNTIQFFNDDKFILIPKVLNDENVVYNAWLENQNIIQTGINLKYRLIDPLNLKIGYNYGYYNYNIVLSFPKTQINIASINFGFEYNIWHQDTYRFNEKQFLIDIIGNVFVQKFSYNYGLDELVKNVNYLNYDITRDYKLMYQSGIQMSYLFNHSFFANFTGNINYYDDIGIIFPFYQVNTRYIDFFLTYGLVLTFGLQI